MKTNQEELSEILSLNRKIFVDCIFREPLIINFIFTTHNFFRKSKFYYDMNFSHCVNLSEIIINLELEPEECSQERECEHFD